MDNWIFPNPDYPDPADPKHIIHVDLDSREPLRKDQTGALNAALSGMIKERDYLSERIRIVTQRLVLSGEEKLSAWKEEHNGS